MASLVLGAFQMIASDGSSRVMAEGTSWGSPVPIEVAINSFLQDGAIVVTQGHDNREVDIKVRFYGDNLTALNAKEALLFAELEKPNTLTWTPDNGPASVFVVVTSSLVQNDESFVGEVQGDPWRTYNVRLLCESFVRSAIEVTAPVLATGATTTVVDTAGATTGWTGRVNNIGATVTAAAGPPTTLTVTSTATDGLITVDMQKTVSLTTSTLKYLIVDWKREAVTPGLEQTPLAAIGDGVTLSRFAEGSSPTSGFVRTWFQVSASSVSVLTLRLVSDQTLLSGYPAVSRFLTIDNISISNVRPSIGSPHQQMQTIAIAGSARTQAALAVESPTSSLGDTLIYVYPDDVAWAGYLPPLRPYRTAGGSVTTSPAQVSGAVENITGTGATFQVPVSRLPRGRHLLMVRVNTFAYGAPTTLTWTAQTTLGAVNLGTVSGTFAVRLTSAVTGFENFAVARLILPTTDVSESSSAVVTLNLKTSSGCDFDEAWLFSEVGQLAQVACGTGTAAAGGAASRVFLEPATVQTPIPVLRAGFSADRSDAYNPTPSAWQFPQFAPPSAAVFTSTSNATDSVLTVRYYPRWHTNAAS